MTLTASLATPRKIAAGIISDNMDAGTKARVSYLTKMLEKIAAANDQARMFSHVVIYFHKNEILSPSPIFKIAAHLGLEIIADTFNADFSQTKSRQDYIDLILRLMDLDVTMARIDDANTKSAAQLPNMLPHVPGFRWILSTGVNDYVTMATIAQAVDSDVKTSAQMYLNGASLEYFKRWLKYGVWGIDFEAYRTSAGYMTTPEDIARMGQEVIAAQKRVLMVYALKDQHTDFLEPEKLANGKPNPKALGKQWAALQAFLGHWWIEVR